MDAEGKVVMAGEHDSVMVVLGGGRCVQLPAALIARADRVLRACHDRDWGLEIEAVEDDDTGECFWEAALDGGTEGAGHGKTPWAALADLAAKLGGA
jgi:hypothetical protein